MPPYFPSPSRQVENGFYLILKPVLSFEVIHLGKDAFREKTYAATLESGKT